MEKSVLNLEGEFWDFEFYANRLQNGTRQERWFRINCCCLKKRPVNRAHCRGVSIDPS